MEKDVAKGDKMNRIRVPIMTEVPITTFAVAEIPRLYASGNGRRDQDSQAMMLLGKSRRRHRHAIAVAVVQCDRVS
jgi:hypothetical protein